MGRLLFRLLDITLLMLTLAYPFLVWQVLAVWSPRFMALLLAAVVFLRLLRANTSISINLFTGLALAGVLFLLMVAWMNQANWLLAYPVFVSLAFFCVFALSLRFPPTVIERLARLEDPNLPPAGIRYTRNVTRVWSVFFLFNASIAAWTVFYGDHYWWTLYNGCIFYVLMGLLMGSEWLIRRKAKARFYSE